MYMYIYISINIIIIMVVLVIWTDRASGIGCISDDEYQEVCMYTCIIIGGGG